MIVHEGDADYEKYRQAAVWNSLVPDRFPDSIARPSNTAQLTRVIQEATSKEKKIAVRSGGHNWLATSLREGGLLVDLGGMSDVKVDHRELRAVVGPAADHQKLADALVKRDMAFPIGHCPSVGLGGYLLAGGMGWNLREWGPACWSVRAADAVMADGGVIRVDESTHPDLLWALRGGSSGFPGIVTSFHLDLFRLPRIYTRHLTFGLFELPGLLASILESLRHFDTGLEVSLIVRPPSLERKEDGRTIVAMAGFADTDSGAALKIEDFITAGGLEHGSREDSGTKLVMLNELEGEGGWSSEFRYQVDTCWVKDRYESIAGTIVEYMVASPSPDSRVVLAFGLLPECEVDAAFTRLGDLTVNAYATWRDTRDDWLNKDWLRGLMSSMSSHASGRYIGETDTTSHPLNEAYPRSKLERLGRIIEEYDPKRIFHSFLLEPGEKHPVQQES